MLTNANGPAPIPSVWPLVACRDARKVAAFLVDALGFEQLGLGEKDGIVTRAEMRWPVGVGGVVLREPHPSYPDLAEFRDAFPDGPSAVFLYAEDLGTLHQRAQESGAEILRPLVITSGGAQAFAVRDPEGNLWSIANRALG